MGNRQPSINPDTYPELELAPAYDIDTNDHDYYDILVIGRTGLGKSSTVDKLMVPNCFTVRENIENYSVEESSVSNSASQEDELRPAESARLDTTGEIECRNLRARILSTEKKDYENTEERLKNIIRCREERESHEKIDKLRSRELEDRTLAEVYSSSKHCELLTNITSKIRVLDAPGFYSPHLIGGATNERESNLATVRHIIHIQRAENLTIKRIVYFLPQSGPLERADRIVQQEIQNLVKFFGATILNCMVLVVTMPPHISVDSDMPTERKLPSSKLEQSQRYFQEAFKRELEERQAKNDELPTPPIIFIAMTDTCEKILEKIMSASVHDDNYQIEFNKKTCCKCGIDRGLDYQSGNERSHDAKDWVEDYLGKEASCHPIVKPMYSVGAVRDGIINLLAFKWQFTKDRCVNCRGKPGSKGCMKINEEYHYTHNESTYDVKVKHSSQV